jgi:uncharacterized protein
MGLSKMKKLFSILFLLLSVVAIGQNFPSAPNPPKLVTDLTKTLSAAQIASLEEKLVAFDNKTSNQVAIVVVNTTEGTQVTDYAIGLGRKWGIGNKQNNGVLLLVALKDRKLAIVPGDGLEGSLPDAVCLAIIDNEITPSFKRNDYFGGLNRGAEAIMQATQGAYTAPEGYDKRGRKGNDGGGALMFIIILIVVVFIMSRGSGGRGGGMMSRRGYRGIGGFPVIFPGGGGGGGWSGGGGSSGGFGGFGGGSFGGGGSSGSW